MGEKLKTIDFKGKEYVEVSERIRYFRENFKGYSLESEWIKIDGGIAICKATIKDDKDRIVAQGTAYEKEGSSFINKTSYIENCETSAWGRALGNFGIGIEGSVASALEVANAIENQNKEIELITTQQENLIKKLVSDNKINPQNFKNMYSKYNKDFKKITMEQAAKLIKELNKIPSKNEVFGEDKNGK